ncbi:hypothetical protein [Dongia sp.]|uniref:hypothetical protein n=1 Tax=Dongia sp. TaxID=1977262 RepID=UPI0035B3757E
MHETNKSARKRVSASEVLGDGSIAELIYDSKAKMTSFSVWHNDTLTFQDMLTDGALGMVYPFSPENNLIRNEIVLLASSTEEYGSQEVLLRDITTYLHRYLDVSPLFEKVASYYVLLTWIYDAFNELPYLRLRGDYGTGKTRALLTIGSLCYKATFASGASTVSPLFHTLDAFHGTLIIDEADFRFSDAKTDIIKILNNGNVRGLPVLRTVMNNQREFNPRAFQVFGPKIVAARGSFDDRALESRFITEEMGQRRLRSDVPINLPDAYRVEAQSLRNKLLLYRFRNLAQAKIDPTMIDPRLEPRLNQILVPLLSVVDDRSLRAELRQVALGYQEALIADRGFTPEADVLEVLQELMADGRYSVSVGDLSSKMAERFAARYERPITARWVGNLLRRKLRIMTWKMHGIYVVPRSEMAKLQLLWERYGIGDARSGSPTEGVGGHGDVGTSE